MVKTFIINTSLFIIFINDDNRKCENLFFFNDIQNYLQNISKCILININIGPWFSNVDKCHSNNGMIQHLQILLFILY